MAVTNTPRITLETGGTDAVVNYSGVTSETLTFNYTVADGHNSSDLTYNNSSSINLNTGTITDLAGNAPASMALPDNATTDSLGDRKALVVDTVEPTVTLVKAVEGNGNFKLADTINVQVTFSEAVTKATADPEITLETGASDDTVAYSGGDGTDTLTFTYTVGAGDINSDLDYTATTALSTAGTLKDAAGNDVTLTLDTVGGGHIMTITY